MLEQTLERIAVALEKIAASVEVQPIVIADEVKVEAPVTATTPVPDDVFAERDRVKKELTELGVPFNNKARTEVLAKLLEDMKAKVSTEAAVPAPSAEPVPANPTQAVEPSISIDVVREAVKKYAAIKGAPKAMELLAKYKANKVSELPEVSYSEVVEFVSQETK